MRHFVRFGQRRRYHDNECLHVCFRIVAVIGACAAPTITKQPSPSTNSVSLGATVSNRITATTTNAPLSNQWRHEGTNLPGRTSVAITLTNVTLSDAGVYTAIVADTDGPTESATWTLDVDATFRKVTSGVFTQVGNSGAVGWCDFNRDGWPELVVC